MESSTIPDAKYHKLAAEYSKLRAQASVLKKAVLEEQAKSSTLRDQLRQRETSIRRTEQEVDSLGFRNKQLEHRVAALQDELAKNEGRKRERETKRSNKLEQLQAGEATMGNGSGVSDIGQDALFFEELQKKIMENAQLTSLVDDKERDLRLHEERIANLEQLIERRATEQSEIEKRLRRDIEVLQTRNSELETKLVEAASMLGSEDALSASGSDNTPIHSNNYNHATAMNTAAHVSMEERIAHLEKEALHWRTQYEIAKLNQTFAGSGDSNKEFMVSLMASTTKSIVSDGNCSCSTTAAGLTVKPSFAESKSAQRESLKEPPQPPTNELLIYNQFSKKYEDLLRAKCLAESHMASYEAEIEHLQNCLENATYELKAKDEQIQSINQALQILEEDLATTRINYEEQISVLTEQVISLSDQLAACK